MQASSKSLNAAAASWGPVPASYEHPGPALYEDAPIRRLHLTFVLPFSEGTLKKRGCILREFRGPVTRDVRDIDENGKYDLELPSVNTLVDLLSNSKFKELQVVEVWYLMKESFTHQDTLRDLLSSIKVLLPMLTKCEFAFHEAWEGDENARHTVEEWEHFSAMNLNLITTMFQYAGEDEYPQQVARRVYGRVGTPGNETVYLFPQNERVPLEPQAVGLGSRNESFSLDPAAFYRRFS